MNQLACARLQDLPFFVFASDVPCPHEKSPTNVERVAWVKALVLLIQGPGRITGRETAETPVGWAQSSPVRNSQTCSGIHDEF